MARRVERRSGVVRAAYRALLATGEQSSIVSVQWDVSRKCERPVHTAREGRDFETRKRPVWLDMEVPCRKCPACLRSRAARWMHRATHEVGVSPRTWFGTLTLRPDMHIRMEYLAARTQRAKGNKWRDLTSAERFAATHVEIGRELTLWLKRVREQSQATLRYLLVAEAHKSGLPHYHVLIHELYPTQPVRHSVLTDQWKHGFTQFKLVTDKRAATYVCKYLAKSALARVRASQAYGKYDPLKAVIGKLAVRKITDPATIPPRQIIPTCTG